MIKFSNQAPKNFSPGLGNNEGTFRYRLSQALKKLFFKTSISDRFLLQRSGGIEPRQLYFVMHCLSEFNKEEPLNIAEVGVARGITTRFLYDFLDSLEVRFNYFMVDTFSGFDDKSVSVEKRRFSAKGFSYSWDNYDYLNFNRYKKRIQTLNLPHAKLVESKNYNEDLKDFEFDFVLLDVDVELATTEYLEFFSGKMRKGGVILVDDCATDNKYEGALHAYRAFCAKHSLSEKYLRPKSGVITF